MTKAEIRTLLEAIADETRAYIDERLAASESRVKALEERPAVRYRGTFDGGLGDYAPHDMVTRAGQLWYCMRATKDAPGQSSDWKLMHKAEGGR